MPLTSNPLINSTRARKCVFAGYPFWQKAYRFYDFDNHKFLVSRDVVFHETIFPFFTPNTSTTFQPTHFTIPPTDPPYTFNSTRPTTTASPLYIPLTRPLPNQTIAMPTSPSLISLIPTFLNTPNATSPPSHPECPNTTSSSSALCSHPPTLCSPQRFECNTTMSTADSELSSAITGSKSSHYPLLILFLITICLLLTIPLSQQSPKLFSPLPMPKLPLILFGVKLWQRKYKHLSKIKFGLSHLYLQANDTLVVNGC